MEVQGSTSSMQESTEPYILSVQQYAAWEEDATAQFVCRLCKKTFYNANALQNHKNLQHDVESSGSDDELQSAAPLMPADQASSLSTCFSYIDT
ncbi:hypothetical protein MSG28_000852 [Choristoneura fumiferana]|uniref:Uncharacterized protein n=1 Tax=Choristoneura fumiferana TaxID=7141 RepID=A0ACC0K325_CHOFU|nr:hypothetical protein MSG28_000852 [Choristoneura fumiferana]